MTKHDPMGLKMLEAHRANLAASKTFEEYRDHHVAYVDCLIEREKARLAEQEAEVKFVYRIAKADEDAAVAEQSST